MSVFQERHVLLPGSWQSLPLPPSRKQRHAEVPAPGNLHQWVWVRVCSCAPVLVGAVRVVSEFLPLKAGEQPVALWEWDGGVEVTVSCSFGWLPGRAGSNDTGLGSAAGFEEVLWTGQPAVWPRFPRLPMRKRTKGDDFSRESVSGWTGLEITSVSQ